MYLFELILAYSFLKYNSNQPREDRKIENYFKKVCESQNGIACEIIIELGDMDFWNIEENYKQNNLIIFDIYKNLI